MKNKWIILVVLFIVLVTIYAVRGVFQSRIDLEVITTGKIEESSTTQGVLIKNEKVNQVKLSGAAEIYAKDGNRVGKNQILAMLYGNTEDAALIKEFAEINKKINAIQKSDADNFIYISDAMQLESQISDDVDDLVQAASSNDFSKISEYKYKISTATAQKAIARGETVTTPAEEMIALQTRKNEIEVLLGKSANIILSDMAGIYAEGKDGFEETLSPDNIDTLTPEDIKDVIKNSKNGGNLNDKNVYTYKIIDNFSYYVAVNLDSVISEGIKVGDSAIVRFSDFSQNDNKATVEYVSSPDEEGNRMIVVHCNSYIKNLLSQRVVNVEFIKSSVSGYKVSVEHIHTYDNAVGLYIKRGAVMRFLPVDIVYSNEEEAIVTSADKSMPIKSYDEIVTSAPEFKDGKVIVSQ